MGDISRHRDIFLNTREAIPPDLLARCNLTATDLTYLELGNYLTDVSQFRDPVFYIFAKQRVWREFVLPKAADKVLAYRILAALAGYAGLAASQTVKELTSGRPSQVAGYAVGPVLAAAGGILAVLPTDTYAGLYGADTWIDKMFGTPIELTIGDPKKRDEKHYGYVGQFFRYFIESVTHLLFADEIANKIKGDWGKLDRIPETSVSAMFEEFFSQYFPHEHTDQPPYVWDASKRLQPKHKKWYGTSKRQSNLVDKEMGVMNAVDDHYVQYLAEGLADLEQEWRTIRAADIDARRKWLIRLGKLLHGVEDWYFHSNVVELLRLRDHKPAQGANETDEEFLKRFVREISKTDREFVNAGRTEQLRLQRRLYRRLRFASYEPANRIHSGGRLSKNRSILSLHLAYPAFPTQQDTTHTLLHPLENLEHKAFHSSSSSSSTSIFEKLPWMVCVLGKLSAARGGEGEKLLEEKAKARGTTKERVLASRSMPDGVEKDKANAAITDVLREWLPLVATLLIESERQRLVADVDPLAWPIGAPTRAELKSGPRGSVETDKQVDRHKSALKRKLNENGLEENNYERAVRYLVECRFLNVPGQAALVRAFQIDQKSQELLEIAPGSGGFLIKFAVDLQRALDEAEEVTAELNEDSDSVFKPATDNGAFTEIIGSHSLMSKDTLASPPFFDEAKVLASVASLSVLHIMLEQIGAPAVDRRLPWKAILHHFIRFPVAAGGWERRAIAFFRQNNGKIPKYSDLPEVARLVESALRSPAALESWRQGTKDDELKEEYIRLEKDVSHYRYP